MRALLVLTFALPGLADVEVYRAWPSTGGPSYSWQGSAADWQRTWQNNTDQYQRNFPFTETFSELFIESSKSAFVGTSDPDIYRLNALLTLNSSYLVSKCNVSECAKALRLQNILSEIGKFTIKMDIKQTTQPGWQDFALGQRSYFLTSVEPKSVENGVNAAGIGFAVGIRTAFKSAAYQSDRVTIQSFQTGSNSSCYRLDCNVLPACGIPCEVRLMNASYVPLTVGTLETPWLNVTYEIDANSSLLAMQVWNGSDYIVPRQVTILPAGIRTASDLSIGIGVFIGSMRVRNFVITTDVIAEPPTPSPTLAPTPFPTFAPSPSPSNSPTSLPTARPTPVPSATSLDASTMPETKQTFATIAPATNAENGSSGISIFLYATPVALLLTGLAYFSWRKAKQHEQAAAQYALTDMTIEPLPPSRSPPIIVPGHSAHYASVITTPTSGYVAPEPQQSNYGELSISSGTGYEPSSLVDVPAYGMTSLATETSRSRRNSRQR